MRRRWALNDNWDWPLIAVVWGALAWLPGTIVGNLIVSGNLGHTNIGFALGGLTAELPLILVGGAWLGEWLLKVGPPVRRVREPVTTDLRRARDD